MRFVIITGLSGAGKTHALRCMEDFGYYCIDNMPPVLIPKFAELCNNSQGKLDKIAVVSDIRSGDMFSQLFDALNEIKNNGYTYEILFLDADDQALIKRYKETRRSHPLSIKGRLADAIALERRLLETVYAHANNIINTTNLTQKQCRAKLSAIFEGDETSPISINVLSFGFKYGIPVDADMVFDARFLPNPYYIDELKEYSGLESCVADYVMKFEQSRKFLDMITQMMDFLLPQFVEEGKRHLVIAIGCTGGKHRSVTLAEALYKHFKENENSVTVIHRDYKKDSF